jgi:hypothetical protein
MTRPAARGQPKKCQLRAAGKAGLFAAAPTLEKRQRADGIGGGFKNPVTSMHCEMRPSILREKH